MFFAIRLQFGVSKHSFVAHESYALSRAHRKHIQTSCRNRNIINIKHTLTRSTNKTAKPTKELRAVDCRTCGRRSFCRCECLNRIEFPSIAAIANIVLCVVIHFKIRNSLTFAFVNCVCGAVVSWSARVELLFVLDIKCFLAHF